MAKLRRVQLTDQETAQLLRLTPATIRRRRAAGELVTVHRVGGAGELVQLSPLDDWIRVEDAGALLGVSPTTVRGSIRTGRLVGRRGDHGRWRVQLASVLMDPRCDPDAYGLFTGEAPPEPPAPAPRRPQRLRRALYVHLDEEEAELLERGRDRHGNYREAVVAGLRAIDVDDAPRPDELAELRAETEVRGQEVERVRALNEALRDRAATHHVDELYCPVCNRLVPIGEVDRLTLEDGTVELFHQEHGHRQGNRLRSSTVLARRAAARHDA